MGKAYKFNPGFQTDEEAVTNFIVRQAELAVIIDTLNGRLIPPRLSVVAPRGAGKTTLCRRVVAEVRTNPELAARWEPIFLGEESYIVTTPGEFFLECLFHLAEEVGDTSLTERHAEALAIDEEAPLLKRCITILRDFARARDRRLLIVVENFHILLNEQVGRERGILLDALADDGLFGVLATSVAQAADEDSEQRGIFDGYRLIPLQPLTLEECHLLWSALTEQDVPPGRIRPLQILTGGSPRLVQILSDFMRTPSLGDLMENLNKLIDQNTEYFKSQLDSLPTLERKVFAALLDAWDPSTAKQIAGAARVNVNTASAMLGRLSDRGSVIKEPGRGRTAYYYAAERLFNIYYLMRRRSHPSSRVRALVAFMTEYYDRDELVATTAKLVDEACQVAPAERGDYHWAYDAILTGQPETVRARIIAQTPSDFLQSMRDDIKLAKKLSEEKAVAGGERVEGPAARVIKLAGDAIANDDIERAMGLLEAAILDHPDVSMLYFQLATAHLHDQDLEAALAAVERGLDVSQNNPGAHSLHGLILSMADRGSEAQAAFTRALEIDPNFAVAINHLAELREDNDDEEGAIELYRAAAALGDLSEEALCRFARLMFDRDEGAEAEQMLRKALEGKSERLESRQILVSWLAESDRVPEAVEVLRELAERSDDWRCWADLGAFLFVEEDFSGACVEFERAIKEGADSPAVYLMLVSALREAKETREAIIGVAEALLERHGDEAWAWIVAGDIFAPFRLADKAEDAYRHATTLENGERAWIRLAGLLAKDKPNEDADAVLHMAVEAAHADPSCGFKHEVAELLVHHGDDDGARALLEQAIALNQNCYCSLVLQGDIAARHADQDTARDHYVAALDLNEIGVKALLGLAAVSEQAEATELIERAMTVDPDNPLCLLARARISDNTNGERFADGVEALKRDPDLTEARLFLSPLEAVRGNRDAALEHLGAALHDIVSRRELIPGFVDTALSLVRLGLGVEVSDLLESEAGTAVEPLAVALRLSRGETPAVAKEVLEVARDILMQLETGCVS